MSDFFRRTHAPLPLFVAMACTALLLVVPFQLPFNTLPLQSFYQEWTAFVLGCVVFVALVWLRRGDGIEIPRTVFLPIGICILLLIQAVSGRLGYWQQSVTGVIYLLWSVAMLCAGAMLCRQLGRDSFCALAAGAISVGALLSSVIGLLQLADWQLGGLVMPMIGPRVHANLAQSNHFASCVSLGLFSVCFLVAIQRLNAFVAVGALLLLLLAADVSGSRSIWAYLLAGLLLASWTHIQSRSNQTRTLLYWVAGTFAGMVAVSIASIGLLHGLDWLGDSMLRHETGTERLLSSQSGVSARQSIWLAGWLMFKGAPLAGVGYGGFAWDYFLLLGRLPAGLPEEIVDNAHNIILQMLAEFGLPGAIVLCAAAAAWCLSAFREEAGAQRWWMLTLVAVIVLHSLVEYPLWYAHFLGLFALLVGAADRTAFRLNPAFVSPTVIIGVGVAMLWMLTSVFLDYRLVERLGVESASNRDNNKVIVEAARVSRRSLFGQYIELGLSRTITLDREALDAKLELNGRVLRTFPAPDVAYRQSALRAIEGDFAVANRMWDLAATAYPGRAAAVADTLAARLATGEVMLEPLVEYAASRSKERQ